MPKKTVTIYYADNTLIVAEGYNADKVQNRTNAALDSVSWHIHDLGFNLTIEKTTQTTTLRL